MSPFTTFIFISNIIILILVLERISERARRDLVFRGPNFWIVLNAFGVSLSPIVYNYELERIIQNTFLHTGLPIAIYLKLITAYFLSIFCFYFAVYRHNPAKLGKWLIPSVVMTFTIHAAAVTYFYQFTDYFQLQLINHAALGISAVFYGGITQSKNLVAMKPIQNNSPSNARQFWTVVNFICLACGAIAFTLDAFLQLGQGLPYHDYTLLTIASSLLYLAAAASVIMSSYMFLIYVSQLPGNLYYYFRLKRLTKFALSESNERLAYMGTPPNLWHLITHINIELYRYFIILSDSLTILPKDSTVREKVKEVFDLKYDYYQTLHLLTNLEIK